MHTKSKFHSLWGKTLCLTIICASAGQPALSRNEIYGNAVVSEVTSIYDADTFRANIDGWPDLIGSRISIRVNGIDAAELRGKCDHEKKLARAAKQAAVTLIRDAHEIELRNLQRGKYFRILADVYLDGNSLAQELIKTGHARPYDGGKKGTWCP